ncbi:hypothetical protein ACEPAI_5996 [Sanghuangporus weigelae]
MAVNVFIDQHCVAPTSHLKHENMPILPESVSSRALKHPRTITPDFALSIVVQWLPWVTPSYDMVQNKMNEIKQRAFTVSPKNVYGLEDNTMLCYWENVPEIHANMVRTHLRKNTTRERMRDLDVISITCHESCRALLSPRLFRSVMLDKGKTNVYRFGIPKGPPFVAPPAFYMPRIFELDSTLPSAKAVVRSDTNTLHAPVEDRSQSASRDYPFPDVGLDRGGVDRPQADDGSSDLQLPSPTTSFTASKKRTRMSLEAEESGVDAKRLKEEAVLPDTQSSYSSANDLRHESTVPIPGLSHSVPPVSVASQLRDDDQNPTCQMGGVQAETTTEHDRALEEGQVIEGRSEIRLVVRKLFERISELEKTNEESRKCVSDLRSALEQAESSKQALEESLQAAQEDCRKLQQHEKDLQSALQKALHDLEEARTHNNNIVPKLREQKAIAEFACHKVEEERREVIEKLRAAEREATSERIRRIAAESVFLDVRWLFSGEDVAPEADRTVQRTT